MHFVHIIFVLDYLAKQKKSLSWHSYNHSDWQYQKRYYTVSKNGPTFKLWNDIARNGTDRFCWYLAEIFRRLYRIEFACFSFHVGLLVITLSSLELHTEINACMLCALQSAAERAFSCSTWDAIFVVNNLRNWWSMDSPASGEISLTIRWLWGFLTQQQRLNCVDVFISMRSASAVARTPVDSSELHQQPVDAVLRPTLVQKLCYKLPSVVTFTFL